MTRTIALALLASALAACSFDAGNREESSDPEDLETDTAAAELGLRDEGARPEIHTVALSTGVTLSYLEQGRKWGDVLIFLHGYTDSHHSFDLNLPKIPKKYHVYALDQRGHGDSSKPACCYTQGDFSGDVVAFMNAMHIPRATLVGHSMGSLIAHKVAVDAPWRVERLVLVGSGPTLVGNAVALDFKTAVDTLTDPVDPVFVHDFQASTFFRPIPPEYLDTAVSESLKVPASVWKQTLDGMLVENHVSELDEIRARTLIFWGDQDIFFGQADQDTLDAEIPRSKLLVYTQTGHGLHAESPDRFVKDLKKFLRN